MGIHVVWDNEENTVIRYIVEGQWSLNEMIQARQQAISMLKSRDSSEGKGLIVDMVGSRFIPNANLLGYFGKANDEKMPNMKIMVFVSANQFVEKLVTLFTRIYGNTDFVWEFASSLEEARKMVNDHLAKVAQPLPEGSVPGTSGSQPTPSLL